MNLPLVYMYSPSWTPFPLPSPYHPSGSSQCTSPEHTVSCIESGLVIRFTCDNLQVSIPFSQIILPLPSPTESKRLFYTSVSPLLSHIQGWRRKWQPTPVFLPGESQGRGAWWAAVSGVTQSRARLKWLSGSGSSSMHLLIPNSQFISLLPPQINFKNLMLKKWSKLQKNT